MNKKEITYIVNEQGCHICTSHSFHKTGYPRIQINGVQKYLSNHIYEIYKGSISKGHVIRHTCDNKACINPEHLITGTHADNMRDVVERKLSNTPVGEKSGKNKITTKQALEIFNSTKSQNELAVIYGISQSVVGRIKLKKTWKHIHHGK